MSIAVYPGSFDPVTYGHIDIIAVSYTHLDPDTDRVIVDPFDLPDLLSDRRRF